MAPTDVIVVVKRERVKQEGFTKRKNSLQRHLKMQRACIVQNLQLPEYPHTPAPPTHTHIHTPPFALVKLLADAGPASIEELE